MKYGLLLLAFAMTGCLKTRSEVHEQEQKQVLSQQVTTLQKGTADTSNRFTEYDEETRFLRGRIEALEKKDQNDRSDSENFRKQVSETFIDIQKRQSLLQEGLTKLEAQLAGYQAEQLAGQTVAAVKKSLYDIAEEHFQQKEWKKAILNYQKFREQNPKSKNYAEATYKIGVCFQEVKMKDEARSFFDEVMTDFPSSAEAKKAKVRLKSLKK